ncbi:MAG TPA: alkaline phosphatase family protein [Bryobacteraceae bacterium]|nr:alkaline phosphatase family protein [Bryobacteraceae bacterium]
MRKLIFIFVLAFSLSAQTKPKPREPKLVLAIVVDQFRYDYLTRFRANYTGGLKRMMDDGAMFTNAHYEHVPTVTAIGHSTVLTGATPAMSGIIGNQWWDRGTQKVVTSVSDDETKLLGGTGVGSSPRRLLQSTVGDELKMSGKGGKVIGVSIKDRSAILPVGHMADGAFWFDGKTGNFVSSTYYFPDLPGWVKDFDQSRPADKYAGKEWMGHKMPAPGVKLYDGIEATPFGNELIEQFALRALAAEKLGANGKIDVLVVSYSANDYVGHRVGPDSPEVRDMAIRVDKLIGDLLRAAEAQVGAGQVIAVMTADHGVAPVPEENEKRKMPGGRLDPEMQRDAIEKSLSAKFGGGKWVEDMSEGVFLNLQTLKSHNLETADVERVAAEAVRALPHVFRVYTRSQLLNGWVASDPVDIRVRNGFNAARSGNLVVIPDPYWMASKTGTTHGTPFDYDAHVPILFLGGAVRPGRYNRNVMVNDIAPTLATILDVETPSGSVGRVLDEMLK